MVQLATTIFSAIQRCNIVAILFRMLAAFSLERFAALKIVVTFKSNSRFFKLCRVYFNSMKMSNVGEFTRS